MIEQVFGFSIYLGIALTLGVVCTLGLGLMLHAGTRIRREPLPLIFLGIIAAIMASPIATSRYVKGGIGISEASFENISSSFWLTRLITIGILLLCVERFARFIMRQEWTHIHSWKLFWAFVAFALTNQVLNGIFGSYPSFEHKSIYAFLLYFSVFLVAQSQPERCFLFVRGILLFFFLASAVAAVLMPTLVIEKAYTGGIGIPMRYYGLATHANTLGPLAVAFMICLWRFPFSSRWINIFSWCLALTSLVLSQSKTTIAAALVIGLFLFVYRKRAEFAESFSARRTGLLIGTVGCVCFFLAAAILLMWLAADSTERLIYQVDATRSGQLTSFTGRTGIWFLAWDEFMENPLFGYGPSIWGDYYRFTVGIRTANSAHNQLLQSLSSAGLVGLGGLIFYICVLATYAWKAAPSSHGISLALVGLMLFRGFLEAPFTSSDAITSDFFVHLLALLACIGFSVPTQPETIRKTGKQGLFGTTRLRYTD